MAKKKTATQRRIDNINSYIKKIASTFGTGSKQYEDITVRLHGKDFEFKDTEILQLRNNKANRAKHQTIRAIEKSKTPIRILKRKALNEIRNSVGIDDFTDSDDFKKYDNFLKWYSELSNSFDSLRSEVYTLLDALEYIGQAEPLDYISELYASESLRRDRWEDVFNALSNDKEMNNGFYQKFGFKVAEDSGEAYQYDNDDFSEYYDIEY